MQTFSETTSEETSFRVFKDVRWQSQGDNKNLESTGTGQHNRTSDYKHSWLFIDQSECNLVLEHDKKKPSHCLVYLCWLQALEMPRCILESVEVNRNLLLEETVCCERLVKQNRNFVRSFAKILYGAFR